MFTKSSTGVMFLLALAGGMFFSAGPQIAQRPPGQTRPVGGNAKASMPVIRQRADGPCPIIRGFLDPVDNAGAEDLTGKITMTGAVSGDVSYQLKPEEPTVTDDSCGEGKLAYMIALVSDPINSHLSLAFDRTVESIQNAASAAGYKFDRYYFPWRPELAREEPDLEKRTAQSKEKQRLEKYPGVLLFRSQCGQDPPKNRRECASIYRDRELAIFLVSETPTYGVNRIAFLRALSYMSENRVAEWEKTVPVIGPNYSGSVPSFRQAMDLRECGRFQIFNGAATDRKKLEALAKPSERAPSIQWSVSSFVHADEIALYRFRQGDFANQRIAILAEDETAFGDEKFADPNFGHAVRTIHFPRDISHFRNAVHPLPDPGTSRAENAPLIRQSLPFDLRESEGRDSVPSLSGQTASAQQADLANITRELNEGRYSLVGIRASDPLDVIFLSRLVREESPEARLFTLDADLLFVRAATDSPLGGMLSVTTYPLLLANQAWTTRTVEFNSFPNRTAEATYNATIAAIASFVDDKDRKRRIEEKLSEYISPVAKTVTKQGPQTPPLWITVLGHSGYWPVSLLDTPDLYLKPFEQPDGAGFDSQWPDRLWLVAFGAATLFGVIYATCVWRVHSLATQTIPRWLEGMWVNPYDDGRIGRLVYLTARTLWILTLYVILIAPLFKTISVSGNYDFVFVVARVLSVLVVLILAWAFVVPLLQVPHWIILVPCFLTVPAICCWLMALIPQDHSYRNYFLAWRSLNLSNGVSPALSIGFAVIGVIWWSWANLRRLILSNDRVPLLPDISFEMRFSFTTLTDSIQAAASTPFLEWRWRLAPALLCFGAIALDPFDIFKTVETPWCGFVMRCVIGLLSGATLLSLSRMAIIWYRLKQFLMHLERHPLRGAFTDLPKERMWSPIMQHGGLQRTYLLEFRALECAKKLKELLLPNGFLFNPILFEGNLTLRLATMANGQRSTRDEAQGAYAQIRNLGQSIVQNVLLAEWEGGSSDTLAAIQDKRDEQKLTPPVPFPVDIQRSKASAEFVVLPYLFYIRTILLQLQNLLFSVVAGYVLLVLAISCYPYQAQRTLSWGMTISLLLLGTVIVMMLAQMSRDAILSRITETTPGKLDGDFFFHLAAAGTLPVLSLVASQFPAVSRFLFSWLQPTLEAIK
jgi:hypothetical protein